MLILNSREHLKINTATLAAATSAHAPADHRPRLDSKPSPVTVALFIVLLVGGALYTAMSLRGDVTHSGVQTTSYLPFLLLGIALLIALGFEFVNGFHDTANAVATVIYTHSLKAQTWRSSGRGRLNLMGVLAPGGL